MTILNVMRTTNSQIQVSGIIVEVEKKNIKNVYLRVYPPNGKVKVSSPTSVSIKAIREFVLSKEDWIRKKIEKIQSQTYEPKLKYISGERHYVQGQRFLLHVIEEHKPPKVLSRDGRYLDLYIRPGSNVAKREKVLREWYRDLLKNQIPDLISKWEQALGVSVNDWGVKKMKTRWGTCNTKAGRIWINLELAKRPKHLLEYVVLHEMVHLKERLHNDRFRAYLYAHMPDWRDREQELKKRSI